MNPLVSIIIPTYNRSHLIAETLKSIERQTYINWECIVIDDGSDDDTGELMKTFISRDSRFQYHHRPEGRPKGANACRNYGYELSKGKYINWFDSDDEMRPDKLQKQLWQLEENEQCPFTICQTEWIDRLTGESKGLRSDSIDSAHRLDDYITQKIFWSILAPLWRRSFLDKHGLRFDESLAQSQEYDFHIRALAITSDYLTLSDPLAIMYLHEDNLSNSWENNEEKIKSNVKVKAKVLNLLHSQLKGDTRIKLLEMLIILYKNLLLEGRFKSARYILSAILDGLKYSGLSRIKQITIRLRSYSIYLSYYLFGRGYNLLKPVQ